MNKESIKDAASLKALIRDGFSLDEFQQANRGFTPQFLRSFASFLAIGPFQFGWDS